MKTYDLFGEMSAHNQAHCPTVRPCAGLRSSGANRTEIYEWMKSNPSTYSSADSPARILAWQERARALTEAGAVFGGSLGG